VPHVEHAPSRLANDRERLDEQVVERLAGGDALAELVGLRAQLFVGEGLDLRFERANLRDPGTEPCVLALGVRAHELWEEFYHK
jgi:hypothetical protein